MEERHRCGRDHIEIVGDCSTLCHRTMVSSLNKNNVLFGINGDTFIVCSDGPRTVEVLYFVDSVVNESIPNNWILVGRMWHSNIMVEFFIKLH